MTVSKGFNTAEITSGAAGDVIALQNFGSDPVVAKQIALHTSGNDTPAQTIATHLGGSWTGTRVGAALDHHAFGQADAHEIVAFIPNPTK